MEAVAAGVRHAFMTAPPFADALIAAAELTSGTVSTAAALILWDAGSIAAFQPREEAAPRLAIVAALVICALPATTALTLWTSRFGPIAAAAIRRDAGPTAASRCLDWTPCLVVSATGGTGDALPAAAFLAGAATGSVTALPGAPGAGAAIALKRIDAGVVLAVLAATGLIDAIASSAAVARYTAAPAADLPGRTGMVRVARRTARCT